jgi:hypothetical protein
MIMSKVPVTNCNPSVVDDDNVQGACDQL